jgi:cryptochrome
MLAKLTTIVFNLLFCLHSDSMSSIVWFRKSLRLHDNEALVRACSLGDGVVPMFILDPHFVETHRIGVNQFSFFLQSLMDVDQQLRKVGSRLLILRGKPETVFEGIFKGKHPFKAKTLLFEKDTTPYAVKRDDAIEKLAKKYGIAVESFSGHTLLDVKEVTSKPGFKAPTTNGGVEKLVASSKIREPLPVPKIPKLKVAGYAMFTLKELGYKDQPRHTAKGGETEGLRVLKSLCGDRKYISQFDKTKTASTTGHTSGRLSTTGLSPYLMCGALSVRMVYHSVQKVLKAGSHTKPPVSLLGQLYFRDMFYLLGATTPNYDKAKGNKYCLEVPWDNKSAFQKAWADGQTGYPYIDGLMRQLKQTGWIHHLGRHAVACFLTRGDLWQSWTFGRDVFHKLLIDADGSVNNGNWLALSGVAPFSPKWFQIYNPIPDGKSALNVDMDGAWLKKFVPELKDMPAKYMYCPWTAPMDVQKTAKCVIGKDYPAPIVDHSKARAANLIKFGSALKARSSKRKADGASSTTPQKRTKKA